MLSTERGDLFCHRHILQDHFAEFGPLVGLPKELKKLPYQLSSPYVDYALIGDFAGSREEWERIQSGQVPGVRPTRSWRCPDGWVEQHTKVPLSAAAQAYLDILLPMVIFIHPVGNGDA